MNGLGRLYCAAILTNLLQVPMISADSLAPSRAAKKAQELVRQLGSDVFAEREKASEQLKDLGLAAKVALEKGCADDDAEIRRRCQELLPALVEVDLHNRIAAFLADKEGKGQHDIPFLTAFRKIAGNDAGSRQLFAEMLQGDTLSFLLDCAVTPDHQAEILERYARRLQQKIFQPMAGKGPRQLARCDLGAVLFIGGEGKAGGLRDQASYMISGMLYQPFARTAVTDGGPAAAMRRLLFRWVNCQTNENVILQLTQSVGNLGLPEATDFVIRVIKDRKVRGIYMAQVLIQMGRQNNKEHRVLLEPFLDDKTMLGNVQFNQIRGSTELRDVALAMLVHLTGQSHKDYGFSFLSVNSNLLWAPNYAGFSAPEQREAAHKKWKAWAAAQVK
jgi:hypothetical protein